MKQLDVEVSTPANASKTWKLAKTGLQTWNLHLASTHRLQSFLILHVCRQPWYKPQLGGAQCRLWCTT